MKKITFLFAFFLSLFGGTQAWADTISEDFESVTVDANDNTKLSNGWFIKGGTNIVTKNVTSSSYWSNNMPDGFDYVILGTGGSYNIGANGTNTAFGQYNNGCTSYLIIPTELTGKIKFYAGGIRTSNTTVKLYRVTYNSSTGEYSIGTQIGSTIYPVARSSSSTRPNWLAAKQQVDLGSEHTMVAFLLNGTAIDEFEAEEYVFTPYVEPATIAATVKGNTAEMSWTAGETEETLTGWNLEYKKSSEEIWTEVHGLGASTLSYSLTNLEVGYSYNVRVNAVYGGNESIWKSTSFNLTYSTPTPSSVDGDGITNVTYGSGAEIVNYNTSKSPFYQDNSAQVGAVTAGVETTVAITFSTGYTYGTVVWVDWNQNYEFEDSEIVFAGESTSAKPNTLNATFTVPSEQEVGNYRMRICAADSYYDSHKTMGTAAGANPTPTTSYCVAQDYTLKVKEAAEYAMSVSDTEIAFGTVKNTTTTKTFTIINDGDNPLTDVSVVSSNTDNFTVSETGFDIAKDGSKEITVTFVKAVEGDYNETITITQANVATPIVLTATATYQTPTPATMDVTLDDVAVGASVDFGTVNKATVKTIKVTNAGEVTLNATIAITGADASCFTSSTTSLEVAGGSNETFTITFNSDAEDVAKNATVTLTAAGLSPVLFNVTGTYSDFWTEDFESGSLSTGWLATNWSVTTFSYTAVNNTNIAKAGASASTIITPRLSANKDDILTWDALFDWYDEGIKVEYSTDDMETWTIADIDGLTKTTASTGSMANAYCPNGNGISTRGSKLAMSFTAPSTGNYYFRFTSSYSGNGVDNFAGFKLNIPDHIMAITGSSIPTSGSYSPSMKATKSFNATVTVKESRGVAEEDVVAKLYMGSTVIGTSDPVDFEANETKMITIECTPTEAATEGVEMHIEVEYAGGTLSTTPETRYVAEFVRLDMTEDSEPTISTGYSAIYDLVTLTRNFVEGWNTFVAPCAVTLNDIHAGAIAYSFSNYEEGTLTFTQVNSATLTAATPYIIYVPSKLDDKVLSWESPVIYSSYVGEENIRTTHNEATFQGTYAPMAAGTMTGKWGVTDEAKIAKGNASASINGFRGYFTLPDGASARLAFTDEDGTTTVINALELNQNVEGVYNLQGQKVERMQKGLYIVNGKKVVKK